MSMMPAAVDAVLIDFYGTVADGDRHQVETTCGHVVSDFHLPVTAAQFAADWGKQFFATVDASNHAQFKTLYECECISLLKTLASFDVECDPTPYVDELKRYWENPPLHGEAKEALQGLRVPVCCVSNVDEEDLQAAIRTHGLRFDGTVSSERARSYKPDRGIFEQALRQMAVNPARCVHVGDSLHSDIGGAQALGITSVWIERDGRIADIGTCRPDHTIKSLLDLHLLIPQIVDNC